MRLSETPEERHSRLEQRYFRTGELIPTPYLTPGMAYPERYRLMTRDEEP